MAQAAAAAPLRKGRGRGRGKEGKRERERGEGEGESLETAVRLFFHTLLEIRFGLRNRWNLWDCVRSCLEREWGRKKEKDCEREGKEEVRNR
jgi:hypothetical protein